MDQLSSAKVLKEGSLNVRGSLKLWSPRYVVLHSNKMISYYKKKQHYIEKKKPSDIIVLVDTTVLNADLTTKKTYSFKLQQKLSGDEIKCFHASSDSERNSWMNAIKNAINGNEVRSTPSPSLSEEKPPSFVTTNKSSDSTSSSNNKKDTNGSSNKKETNGSNSGFSKEKLQSLFEIYQDKEEENLESTPIIGPSGIENFCKDLIVDPENVVVLVLAWSIGATKMGFFQKSEFMSGFEKLGCDSIEKIKTKLKELRKMLEDDTRFKEIYKWAFNFAKEPNQRALDAEIGVALLKLLTKEKKNRFPHSEGFCEFLSGSRHKALNMDHWMSFHQFNLLVKPDFSNFNSEDAWPTMFDDYVEWKKNKSKETKSEESSS